MPETYEQVEARRREMIKPLRGNDMKALGMICETASASDLEWLLQAIENQLDETPNWVEDKERLAAILAKTRHQRIVVMGALHNRRTLDARQLRKEEQWKSYSAVVISVLALIVSIIALFQGK
jgi:hypothetical protein